MRRFNTAYRGAAPGALVKAIDTCIVPIATYGADVWWPGLRRPTVRGMVTPPTAGLCSMIDKAVLMGLRSALPVMRTTPNAVLHREGGIPTGKIILEGNRLRLSARMQTLDDRHPLRIRAAVCPNVGTRKYKKHNRKSARPEIQMSRAQRAYRQLPEAEAVEPLASPFYQLRPGSKVGSRKDQVEACKLCITNVPKSEIWAYSDGAPEGKGRSAWGFV